MVAFVAASVILDGCTRASSGARDYLTTTDTSVVTADVARSLSSSGQFVLSGPSGGTLHELSEDRARNIARLWVKQFFPWVRRSIETARGGKIDPSRLRVCSRIYYAESPYEPLDETADGGAARRAYGPWWIVPLCVEGVPQVFLGIASYATDIEIRNDQILLPRFGGSQFVWRGIPTSVGELPVSPERAAQLAAQRTGSRVASVPRLVMPHFRDGGPALARWELTLTPAVRLRTAQGEPPMTETRLFVGPEVAGQLAPVLLRAAPSQPDVTSTTVRIATTGAYKEGLTLKRRSSGVVRFLPILPLGR
jgi:hypothetical protein